MQKMVHIFLFLFLSFLSFNEALLAKKGFLTPLRKDNSKIDVVYTWVNGKDPAWQKIRQSTFESYTLPKTAEANFRSRFRNRDELKYSLRSIHKYAKWVNHIYIVTFNQRPAWLKKHPKITVIDHKTIFKNPGYLPTFNSMAIEANLHRIPNLSEKFIYFNDDVLLGRPVKPRDFYSRHGKIKIFFGGRKSPIGVPSTQDNGFTAGWKNVNGLLNNIFKKESRELLAHAPFPLRKSLLEQLSDLLPQVMDKVSSHKFRSPDDYCVLNGLVQHFALYHKQARKGDLSSVTVAYRTDPFLNESQLARVYELYPHTFCVEDVANANNADADLRLKEFFEDLFPQPAPWEM